MRQEDKERQGSYTKISDGKQLEKKESFLASAPT